MIIDLSKSQEPVDLHADVCIVGGGAAGITLTRALAKDGLEVCLLESGGWDYEPAIQDLADGSQTGFPYYNLRDSRLRFLGGTTSIWGGRCAELDDIDFERRAWVAHSGWPFGKDELRPYYRKVEEDLGLAVFDGGPDTWRLHRLAPPPFDANEVTSSFWQFDMMADRFAASRCQDLIDAPNVRVVLHATAVDIETRADGGAVTAITIADLSGRRGKAFAKDFVLAAGGLETPRLLLAAGGDNSSGLGNQHDLVGRFFMEHPHGRGGAISTTEPYRLIKVFPRSYRRNGHRFAALGRPGEALQRREGLLNTSFTIAARQPTDDKLALTKSVYRSLREELTPSKANRALWHLNRRVLLSAREYVGPALAWAQVKSGKAGLYVVIRAEQAPNPESRVTLGQDRDALGMRKIVLDWRFSELDKHTVKGTMLALDRELKRLGWGRVAPSTWLDEPGTLWQTDPLISNHPIGGFHHMGTTRMAADPRHGVVGPDCKVHGIGNLFIAGSSVFPTGGWANPTITILALAYRLAGHLARPRQAPRVRSDSGRAMDATGVSDGAG